MVSVKLSPAAQEDLAGISEESQEKFGIARTLEYLKAIESTINSLTDHPEMGRRRSEISSALRSIPSGSHLIFYHLIDDKIYVDGVLHQALDLGETSRVAERLRTSSADQLED